MPTGGRSRGLSGGTKRACLDVLAHPSSEQGSILIVSLIGRFYFVDFDIFSLYFTEKEKLNRWALPPMYSCAPDFVYFPHSTGEAMLDSGITDPAFQITFSTYQPVGSRQPGYRDQEIRFKQTAQHLDKLVSGFFLC